MTRRSALHAGWTLLLIAVLVVGAVPAGAADGVAIGNVQHAGPGVVDTDDSRILLAPWLSSTISVALDAPDGYYALCIHAEVDSTSERLNCRTVQSSGDVRNLSVTLNEWPANATGGGSIRVVVSNASDSTPLAVERLPVYALSPDGDPDGDGLDSRSEVDLGTDPVRADTDGDGLPDGVEVNTHETDPRAEDTDGDNLSDAAEVNAHGSNPNALDTDGDGLADGEEVTRFGTSPTESDSDDDGLSDGEEVNVHETDPMAADTDGDGLADGKEVNVHETDPTAVDTDEDGLSDAAEVQRHGTNPTVADTDGDGLADGEEVNAHGTDPTRADTDGDGIADGAEIDRGTDPASTGGLVSPSSAVSPVTAAVAIGVLALLAVAGIFFYARRGASESVVALLSLRGIDAREDHEATTASDESVRADSTDRAGDGDRAELAESPERPLSDDRVVQLLDANDGRMRQSAVVKKTGWSKSKVSRILSRMDDEGEIVKISIGRENLIALPDNVPEFANSPFEK